MVSHLGDTGAPQHGWPSEVLSTHSPASPHYKTPPPRRPRRLARRVSLAAGPAEGRRVEIMRSVRIERMAVVSVAVLPAPAVLRARVLHVPSRVVPEQSAVSDLVRVWSRETT